jgi:hypothetical protein
MSSLWEPIQDEKDGKSDDADSVPRAPRPEATCTLLAARST